MQHKVFNGFVISILVDAREAHLATYGKGALCYLFGLGRDKQHVVFFQGHVGHFAAQYAPQVNAQHFEGAVGLHTMNDGAVCEGCFGHAVGLLNERAHAVNLFAQVIEARTEHGAFQLNGVLIALQHRVD